MLYFEDWQGGKKGDRTLKALLPLVMLLVTACHSWENDKDHVLTMEAFSDMKTPAFVFDSHDITQTIREMAKADKGQQEADRLLRNYYADAEHPLVWVDRMGVDQRADTLLAWLHRVGDIGLSEHAFSVADIEQDLQRMRQLDFDDQRHRASEVAARLEYRLTKACLRYCCGQRFGFVNPHRLFNNLDIEKQDSLRVLKYRGLFDVSMETPDARYVTRMLHQVQADSLSDYLYACQPSDSYYQQLKRMLPAAATSDQRRRILVNMERARWRRHQPVVTDGKRVVVNIPAYHLYAYGPDGVLDMKVVCGNVKTKTPQLSSYIEWMEVDPQWVIPMSIIENEVSRRAGDSAYFARNRYNIYDKATNRQIPVTAVTSQMLNSGKYRVAQEGGAGNSLGRIVFRFKNNFSVFLHDTSNPGAFSRDSRAMSHGCVRVSKPFDLAQFVLDNPDEWLLDRIRISMDLPPMSEQGREYVATHGSDNKKLISYVPVKPRVPIYILYYTLWPDADGILQTWPDVYGYDDVMWKQLKPLT